MGPDLFWNGIQFISQETLDEQLEELELRAEIMRQERTAPGGRRPRRLFERRTYTDPWNGWGPETNDMGMELD